MPVSCSLYALNGTLDTDQLAEELPEYSHSNYNDDVEDDLLTTVDDVVETQRGLAATVRYDRPLKIGARPGENPWVKNTINTRIRFVKDLFSPGFLVLGSKKKRTQTVSQVAAILNVMPNDCEPREISSAAITRIVADDSVDSTIGWWEDVGPRTSSASVTGDIDQSTIAQDIDNTGNPTWVIFISEYKNMKVGVSNNNVVFYGDGWDGDEMEDYIVNVVLPRL